MITLTTALPCEAKPLIEKFGLQHQSECSAFRLYQNDDLRLIVTGVGKLAAAGAVSFLSHAQQHEQQAWLNVGITGHASHEIGTAILAHKIIDAGNQQCWYPALINSSSCTSDTITTVDQIQDEYSDDSCYDMEASSFFSAASRFNNIELIHSLKVVSDNRHSNTFNITANLTSELIAEQLEHVEKLIEQLRQMTAQLNSHNTDNINIDNYIEQWHFTHNQRHQLRQLLQRWNVIFPGQHALKAIEQNQLTDSKAVLKTMRQKLNNAPVSFS